MFIPKIIVQKFELDFNVKYITNLLTRANYIQKEFDKIYYPYSYEYKKKNYK